MKNYYWAVYRNDATDSTELFVTRFYYLARLIHYFVRHTHTYEFYPRYVYDSPDYKGWII